MASHPPSQCCTIGVKHEGTPQGKMQTVEGTETYVATPEKPHDSKAILLLTDAMGHGAVNSQLIADQFAANGYLTHMPDLFHGDAVPEKRPEGFEIMKWLKGAAAGGEGEGHMPPRVEPVVKAAIKHLREKAGIKRLATVGYCFGAKYVVLSLAKGYGADVGYCAHPSFVEADEVKRINNPFAIAAAETDNLLPPDKRHETEAILKELGHPYQINLYSGVEHGFAVRGDLANPQIKYAKETAFLQAVQWFDQWL